MRYKGESMVRAKLEVSAACCRLHATGNLPDEVSIDILKGLQKTSVDRFSSYFAMQLQRVQEANLVPGCQRAWGHHTYYKETEFILIQALEFHKFSQVKELGSGPIQYPCHNCGELGHRVRTCDKPRNEDRIAQNVKKFN